MRVVWANRAGSQRKGWWPNTIWPQRPHATARNRSPGLSWPGPAKLPAAASMNGVRTTFRNRSRSHPVNCSASRIPARNRRIRARHTTLHDQHIMGARPVERRGSVQKSAPGAGAQGCRQPAGCLTPPRRRDPRDGAGRPLLSGPQSTRSPRKISLLPATSCSCAISSRKAASMPLTSPAIAVRCASRFASDCLQAAGLHSLNLVSGRVRSAYELECAAGLAPDLR